MDISMTWKVMVVWGERNIDQPPLGSVSYFWTCHPFVGGF